MVGHFCNSGIICHYKTVKPPLLTQYIRHQPLVSSGRNAIDLIERGHRTAHTGINRRLIGQHVFIEHALMAHIYCIIVTSCLTGTIQGKMLYTSHNLIITAHILSLITTYHGLRNGCSQKRVFTVALGHTPPTGITANIHHRTECPANTVGTGLNGRNTRRFFNRLHIPCTRQSQRNGKHRFISMNNIHTE